MIDSDLDKMTAPLEDEKVDKFQLKSKNESLAEADRSNRSIFRHTSQAGGDHKVPSM
ncbi:MAG TPA: hypothetical protein VKZ53_17100 [Candidatus Angelobacter sp.]|nr:hypothetical protein [Candidatus Angelobacter sp.]